LTQGSQSLALGLTLTTAPQLVEVTPKVSPRNPQKCDRTAPIAHRHLWC